MKALTFVHVNTNRRVVCATAAAIQRFLDNRDPDDWFWVPAKESEIREARH